MVHFTEKCVKKHSLCDSNHLGISPHHPAAVDGDAAFSDGSATKFPQAAKFGEKNQPDGAIFTEKNVLIVDF